MLQLPMPPLIMTVNYEHISKLSIMCVSHLSNWIKHTNRNFIGTNSTYFISSSSKGNVPEKKYSFTLYHLQLNRSRFWNSYIKMFSNNSEQRLAVLFSSFPKNSHIAWFDPQTKRLEAHCITKQLYDQIRDACDQLTLHQQVTNKDKLARPTCSPIMPLRPREEPLEYFLSYNPLWAFAQH